MHRRSFLKAIAALPILGGAMAKLLPEEERYARGGIVYRRAMGVKGEAHVPLADGQNITVNIGGIDPASFRVYMARNRQVIRETLRRGLA